MRHHHHRNMRILACGAALLLACLLAGGCATAAATKGSAMKDPSEAVIRVNCGAMQPATTRFAPKNPQGWSFDQAFEAGKNDWGAVGGDVTVREPSLPIADTAIADVYRAERFNVQSYRFQVPAGVYTIRLHCAETYECSYASGHVFDIQAGPLAIPGFDVMQEAGGFGRPVVVDFAGVPAVDDQLQIAFGKGSAVNGIEIFKGAAGPARIVKHAHPAPPIPALPAPPAGKKVTRVLFIGNSFTGFWELTKTIAAMVNTGPSGVTVETDQCINPGKWLQFHYEESDAVKRIREGHYDYVSIQPYMAEKEGANGAVYFRKFSEAIRASGAKMLIYGIWGEQERAMCERAAQENGATLVPVGQAWAEAEREKPGIALIGGDRVHPGMYGDFLAVCCFYSVLTGQSPEGHPFPYVLVRSVRIDDAMAPVLERIAWETVQKYRPLTHVP